MISREEVEKIAKLARLKLTAEETEKMQKDMSAILDYFNLLKGAPRIDAKTDAEERGNELRKDEVIPRDARTVEMIIAGFPDRKDDYIKVKSIL